MIELNSVIATWLATYFVHSTLLLGGAWIAIRLLSPSLPFEETLWKGALLLGIVSSMVLTIAGSRDTPVPAYPSTELSTPVIEASRPVTSALVEQMPARVDWARWSAFFPAMWLAGMFVGLALILLGRRRLLRSIGRRKLVTDRELLLDLSNVRETADFGKPVCLTSSQRLISPLAIGSVEIAVSEGVMSSLTRAQRVSVLAHEMAHLTRRDPLWRMVSSIIIAIFFFQPLNRIASRRMREIAEFLADGAAGRNGHHIALAECLTNIAGRISSADPYAVALTGTPSMLLRRIQRLVASAEYPQPRAVSRLAAVAPLVLIIGLAPDIDLRSTKMLDTAAADSAVFDKKFKGRILNDTELVYTSDHNGKARERIILRAHRVVIAPDGTNIEGVLPGGRLEIIMTGERVTPRRALLKREKNGTLSTTYWREGAIAPFDTETREWMKTAFAKVYSWSTRISEASGEPGSGDLAISY